MKLSRSEFEAEFELNPPWDASSQELENFASSNAIPKVLDPNTNSWRFITRKASGDDPAATSPTLLAFVVFGESTPEVLDAARRAKLAPHPNLVSVEEIIEIPDSNAAVIVYEKPAGVSLANFASHALRAETTKAVVGQVALALHDASTFGLRHGKLDEHRVFIDIESDQVSLLGVLVEAAADLSLTEASDNKSRYLAFLDLKSLGRLLFVGLTGRGSEFFSDSEKITNPALVSSRTVPAELAELTSDLLKELPKGEEHLFDLELPFVITALRPWQSLPVTLEAFDPEAPTAAPEPGFRNETAAAALAQSNAAAANTNEEVPAEPTAAEPTAAEPTAAEPTANGATDSEADAKPNADVASQTAEHRAIEVDTNTPADPTPAYADADSSDAPDAGSRAEETAKIGAPITVPGAPITVPGRPDSTGVKPKIVAPSAAMNSSFDEPPLTAALPVKGRQVPYHASQNQTPEPADPSRADMFRAVVGIAMDSNEQPAGYTDADLSERANVQSRIIMIGALLLVVLIFVWAINTLTAPLRDREVSSQPPVTQTVEPEETKPEEPEAEPEEPAPAEPEVNYSELNLVRIIYPYDQSEADYPENAALMTDGDSSTFWHTYTYFTPDFGGLKDGIGIHLGFGEGVVQRINVETGSQVGGTLEVLPVGADDIIGDPIVSINLQPNHVHEIELPEALDARDLVLWAPDLGEIPDGYRLEIAEITIPKDE